MLRTADDGFHNIILIIRILREFYLLDKPLFQGNSDERGSLPGKIRRPLF